MAHAVSSLHLLKKPVITGSCRSSGTEVVSSGMAGFSYQELFTKLRTFSAGLQHQHWARGLPLFGRSRRFPRGVAPHSTSL